MSYSCCNRRDDNSLITSVLIFISHSFVQPIENILSNLDIKHLRRLKILSLFLALSIYILPFAAN